MTSFKTHRMRETHGSTLIELLIVILIIGILAAIALPAFLGQRDRARDANAKSDARNLVTQIEACYQSSGGYVGCGATFTVASTGLPIGTAPGQVSVPVETVNGYEITAVSRATGGGSNHTFTIIHNIGGVFAHDCTPRGQGGCPTGGDW